MKKIIFIFLLLLTLTACNKGLIPNNNHILEPGMVCTILDKQYPSVMEALNEASDKAVINLYQSVSEEIYIKDKTVSIIGKGDNIIINKPEQLYHSFTTSRTEKTYGIVIIKGGSVSLENITIDGKGELANNQQTVGIGIIDSNISFKKVRVMNIFEPDPDIESNNNGIGILLQNSDDEPSQVQIIECKITNFQKGGIYLYNSNIIDGFQFTIRHNTITGTHQESVVPQTGLLIAGPASGKIADNKFSELSYGPATTKAQAILGIDIDLTKIVISNNTFENVDQELLFNE